MSEDQSLSDELTSVELREVWSVLSDDERFEGFGVLKRADAEHFFEQLSSGDRFDILYALPLSERRSWLRLLAPDDIADALTNDSFRASIDLSQVEPRAGAEPVEVPVDVFPVDPRVRVVDYSPTGVTIRVDEVVSRAMPVIIDHGPLPEGIELGPVIAEPNQVSISGASSIAP